MNLKIFKYIFLLFLGWLGALLLISYLSLSLLPNQDFYSKKLFYPSENLQYFIRWSNWDGGAYRTIAESGYSPRLSVFFPAYPLLIKIIMFFGFNSFWAAIIISLTSSVTTLFFLYKLTLLDFNEQIAKKAVFALLILPTSFYLIAVYNESLTLALILSAFYFARKEKWFWSFFLSGVATLTRLSGIALLLGIIFEYFFQNNKIVNLKTAWQTFFGRIFLYTLASIILLNGGVLLFRQNQLFSGIIASVLDISNKAFLVVTIIGSLLLLKYFISKINIKKIFSRNFLYLAFSFLPFALYLFYQEITFGSPLTFLQSELSYWGRTISFPWQGLLFNLSYIFSHPLAIGEFSSHIHVQLLGFLFATLCLIFSYKKLRLSYTIFYLMALIIPLFSGMLADITRFILIIFPIFIILAQIKNEIIQKTGIIFSCLMLCLLLILFFNSYFFI